VKRRIAPLVLALLAFPAGALAAPSDLRAPDQRTASDLAPRLEAAGTDVAAPDQQASTRSAAPVPVTAPAPAADGFDWGDAGIGSAGAAAVIALALSGGIALRRRRLHSSSPLVG
jgi:hypothetical protein